MKELIYKDEAYRIIGACMAVHRELGMGFLEPVYQEALSVEFELQNIPFSREVELEISYKRKRLNYLKASGYQLGLVVNFGRPNLECKRIACTRHFNSPNSHNSRFYADFPVLSVNSVRDILHHL